MWDSMTFTRFKSHTKFNVAIILPAAISYTIGLVGTKSIESFVVEK